MPRLPQQGPSDQIASTRALMRGLIDYAGLFPPSELPLGEAIDSFARYRVGSDSWMLSRFIIPASKLEALDEYTDTVFSERPPFRFSVVVKGGNQLDSFLVTFRNELQRIKQFQQHHGDRVSVEMLETKLPVDPKKPINPEVYVPLFETVERAVRDDLGKDLPVFFEVPWKVTYDDEFGSTFDDLFDHATDAIALYNDQPPSERITAGMKLRCGDVTPDGVPDAEIVESAIFHAARRGVPFKGTAGLHHPVRRYHDGFGGYMHGFLNVFGAGLLARELKLPRDVIGQIIREEDPKAFIVTDSEFGWREHRCSVSALDAGRAQQFISYGSCSFDEPREELVELGLLS